MNKLSTKGERQGNISIVTTNLFPNLTFGCYGTIVRLTVAVAGNNYSEYSALKFQIWRKNETHSGVYYKPGRDIPISNSSCETDNYSLKGNNFQCTLHEKARVSVQPGDILGLEIPPTGNQNDYEILFDESQASVNYIFQSPLSSIVNISEANSTVNRLPQIIPLVILGTYRPHMLCIHTNVPTYTIKKQCMTA